MAITRRSAIASACAFPLSLAAGSARASEYPSKIIELIVPVAAGGGTDMVGRAFAEAAKKYLPQQPMIVLNKPGASGAVGTAELINGECQDFCV